MRHILNEKEPLRVSLIGLMTIIGFVLVILGWKLTGQLSGLGMMIIGLILLLSAIGVYNDKYK